MCSITARRPGWASRRRKNPSSRMQPYLMTSAMPSEKVRSSSVERVSVSMRTSLGCQKAPARFFPAGRSTATFPPTEESTWARRVVGSWTRSTPRRKVAAAKPARSPTTPPPRAATASVRVRRAAAMSSQRRKSSSGRLALSPAGTTRQAVRKPAARRLPVRASRYRGATLESVTTKIFSALGRAERQYIPAWSSRPGAM